MRFWTRLLDRLIVDDPDPQYSRLDTLDGLGTSSNGYEASS